MTISFKVSEKTIDTLKDFYFELRRDKTPAYAIFQAQDGDTVVTLYESGKIVFQGRDADLASKFWIETEALNGGKVDVKNSEEKKEKNKVDDFNPIIYNSNTIGSDEVGTGDYFGPIVVTAAYVNRNNIKFLESLGVRDSKKLTDEKIKEIVPKIIARIPYKSMVFSNKEYNEKYNDDINMNKIKAILHNKVLMQLSSEINDANYIVVDEFAKPYVYYNYLKETNHLKNITFMTKAEDKVLSVAAASIISRFIFLREIDKISREYNIEIPKGAGDKVDEVGRILTQKYGFDILKNIAKLNFKNTLKIKNNQ